jgi:UDP-GlcNAc:undecaprenyl-phosphate GlcNAc-1-phosphate transferase
MFSEQATQSFLSIVTLVGFFVILIVQKTSSKIGNGILLDQDFDKPQAFHTEPIPRSGGLASFISLMFFIFIYNLLFGRILNDYLFLSIIFFSLGFLEDIKIKTNPNIRLIFMIIALTLSIIFLSINIDNIDIGFLKLWTSNRFFEVSFILLCFLFVINGANLIDGFNGLLVIHLILINFILLLINIENQNMELALIITGQIAIFFSFLLFNFPKAKIFLGDSGSYLFGSLSALNIILTNNLNPAVSSFFFGILLFYLFFEVFFSFFRKLYLRISPLKPDTKHLHMLSYYFLKKSLKFKDCNYINSVILNTVYLFLISPGIFFYDNAVICRYLFFSLLLSYIIFYFLLYNFEKRK